MSDIERPQPLEETEDRAMYIAMVVRDAMENFHHKHLSDEQMKELNPTIRNAISLPFMHFRIMRNPMLTRSL